MPRTEYTTQDSAGFEVKKGDRVTVSFTGEVRSVSRDGTTVIRTGDGTVTAYYRQYQTMHKTHDSLQEYLGIEPSPTAKHNEVRKTFITK